MKTGPSGQATPISRKKLWCFRVLAVSIVPLLFCGMLEGILRLTGIGYPASFLLPVSQNGREGLVPNNQFGWRFFGPRMSRLPDPFFIPRQKDSNTLRIIVLGESAAKGEPQPAFGPARMLQAMLNLRYPGVRFEVVNAAMTAINSHAIVPIARDFAKADADIWVIYMGNNEVVGPFGAGTVFGRQSPPLPIIRGTLALKATRTGQMLDSLLGSFSSESASDNAWHGMKMFLDQQVRADDPRMASVYANFERNLRDIVRIGHRSGVGIVVSTVAVNLRDCAPFGSAHRTDLTDPDRSTWEQNYQAGIDAQQAGQNDEAARHLEEAARHDDTFAELRFRQGECALALGRSNEAQTHFRAARDLDTLRFRCDSRLNEIIRQIATNHESERVLLVDAERAFSEQNRDYLPGNELFYEHVHLNFHGNYLLARVLAEQIEKLLPNHTSSAAARPWPSEEDCAARLAWADWSRREALQTILGRIQNAPFVGQANHIAQLQKLTRLIEQLSPTNQAAELAKARAICEEALSSSPDDAVLYVQLAALVQLSGDLDAAASAARRGVERVPGNSEAWLRLGLILFNQRKLDEAAGAFRRATELDPVDVMSRQNLAQCYGLLGRREEAIAEYRRATKMQPQFAMAWLGQGQALEEWGRKAEADTCFQKALACHVERAAELTALARFCRSRGWREAAITNYDRAIAANPTDVPLRIEAGQNLASTGQFLAAADCFAEAIRISPNSVPAHQFYGSALGQLGRPMEAERQFREVLRLAPDLLEARLNLGISLMSQGRLEEALENFATVLQRSPTNELALRYSERVRTELKRP